MIGSSHYGKHRGVLTASGLTVPPHVTPWQVSPHLHPERHTYHPHTTTKDNVTDGRISTYTPNPLIWDGNQLWKYTGPRFHTHLRRISPEKIKTSWGEKTTLSDHRPGLLLPLFLWKGLTSSRRTRWPEPRHVVTTTTFPHIHFPFLPFLTSSMSRQTKLWRSYKTLSLLYGTLPPFPTSFSQSSLVYLDPHRTFIKWRKCGTDVPSRRIRGSTPHNSTSPFLHFLYHQYISHVYTCLPLIL